MEQVAAAAVDVTNFVTASEASIQAFKTATLLKSLTINALIMGEDGVGKRTLASFILPNATVIDSSHHEELLQSLEISDEIIITNIEHFPNMKTLVDAIKEHKVRVVATSKQSFSNEHIDDIFSVKLDIPPLATRKEDVEELIDLFVKDAVNLFGGERKFDIKNFNPDLSSNANSLRRQVMISYLLQDITDTELMGIMENFLFEKLGSNSDYRNFLYLYEAPLIKAGLAKYKSQLQLSDRLGLNRNTLRKKIAENSHYLEGE